MSELRAIDLAPLIPRYSGPMSEAGKKPEMKWLDVADLRIDPRYQREIRRAGIENILYIAIHFKWAKFTPVVVAPVARGLYAIVDGQHRTTAAALRGFKSVPCIVITASEAEQADAFVDINAKVTAMSPLQLHAARLAAGDATAAKLAEVCREADVTICRYPVPANNMKAGETLAVAMLQSALKRYGHAALVSALCCITQTRRGNVGMIRAQIIDALCAGISDLWLADRARLVFAMQTFDFAAQFNLARTKAIETGAKVASILAGAIARHLEERTEIPLRPKQDTETPTPAQTVPAPDPSPAPKPLFKGSFSISRDEIGRGGKRLKIVPRASLLLQALAKAKPNPVGDEYLIAKIWAVKPAHANELLDQLVRDLGSLKTIGLEIRSIRGAGRKLVELEA